MVLRHIPQCGRSNSKATGGYPAVQRGVVGRHNACNCMPELARKDPGKRIMERFAGDLHPEP